MTLKFLDYIKSGEIPKIVVLVLFHSMWQGLVLSFLAWLTLQFTKKWSSNARYNLLVFFLFAFAGCVLATASTHLARQPFHEGPVSQQISHLSRAGVNTSSVLQFVSEWVNLNAGWIFMVWCLIFLFKLNQMVGNLVAIDKLRRLGNVGIDLKWNRTLEELKTKLGIRRRVDFNESTVVTQPMIIGVLKPMILVPIGLLNDLQPKEVEAILLHELAHIRRNDFLVNLIQSLVDTVFFFNPAVYWLSAMIRAEREHCCDSIAVKHSGDKKHFLQALLAVHEKAKTPILAMPLIGKKSLLIARVNRIINGNKKTMTGMEKFLLLGSYVMLFLLLVSFSLLGGNQHKERLVETRETIQKQPSYTVQELQEYAAMGKIPFTEKKFDTIPKNPSKEFMEGYRAGLNYKNRVSESIGDDKKAIEMAYKNGGDSTPSEFIKDNKPFTNEFLNRTAGEKMMIELRLKAKQESMGKRVD